MAKLVDKTYGDALFELALEGNCIDLYFEESKSVFEIFKESINIDRFRVVGIYDKGSVMAKGASEIAP